MYQSQNRGESPGTSSSFPLMGSFFPVLLIFLSLGSSVMVKTEAQGIKSARLLDLVLRDYTIRSYNTRSRTGKLHPVHLPANFSGTRVDTVKFRCGSLRRYGAQVKEFRLGIGVKVSPCAERVIVITQNLGDNLSSVYYQSYNLSGYQLVSPVLGLLAYNAGDNRNYFNNPFEIGILAGKTPIKVDFSNTTRAQTVGTVPLCATFERDGTVTLANQTSPYVCVTSKHGHFGLVMESPELQGEGKRMNWWKVAVGASIGATLGAFLLGLLLVAMFAKVKKRSRMEELERRAYEEEALQVSMVGHVRAPIAAVTRTMPSIRDEYTPPPP